MTVILDGETMEGATGAESLARMREALRLRRRVPARLKVDGSERGLDQLGALGGKERTVELETQTLLAAAAAAYTEATDYLPRVEKAAESCSDSLMMGRVKEAMAGISGICQGVAWFFSLLQPLDALVGVDPVDGWRREAEEFKPLLLATEDAIAQQDWMLLSDQLRYEWSPRLRLWTERLPRARAEAARLAAEL
jgi:hypothetical protein